MQKSESRLTVFFDEPFWVAVYERITDGKLEVYKITVGAEPIDYQVYDFLLQNLDLRFSPPVKTDRELNVKISPKGLQRMIKKQLEAQGVDTKSQQALKLPQQENKTICTKKRRAQKEEEKERQFELWQQQRKEKHRGR